MSFKPCLVSPGPDAAPGAAAECAPPQTDRVALWGLRILVRLGGHKRLRGGSAYREETLQALGMDTDQADRLDSAATLRWLEGRLAELEVRQPARPAALAAAVPGAVVQGAEIPHAGAGHHDSLARNLDWLARTLVLNRCERDVLAFSLLAHAHGALKEIAISQGELDRVGLVALFACALDLPAAQVRKALAAGGALFNSGLLRVCPSDHYAFDGKIELLDGLADWAQMDHDDPLDMLTDYFSRAPAPRLTPGHFPHVAADLSLLRDYLGRLRRKPAAGVNILIYGRPGTGKTELARLLAREAGFALYEVASEGRDGDPLDSRDRFSAYRLSQRILARERRSALLFDEIEDVFQAEERAGRSRPAGKGWINRLLEENPVPAFWLANRVWQIDPAFLRRFDFVLEMRPPTRSVRAAILRQYLHGLPVEDTWVEGMARHPRLSPAHIERAAKVVRRLRHDDAAGVQRDLERVLGNALEVVGQPRRARGRDAGGDYDLGFLNTDVNLEELADGLARGHGARACLYGPPGTGKTAFGHYLARRLDRPLLVRRASDLLSKWVGETERNLATAFREAEEDGAILLLDEADSFLPEREGAQQSWEVSQVNELLVQMEEFGGIFLASTNRFKNLDSAALRRFDFKVKFDFLRPEQNLHLFERTLARLGVTALGAEERLFAQARLTAIDKLTPGDFANVERQARLLTRAPAADGLLGALEREVQAKPEAAKRKVGFTH